MLSTIQKLHLKLLLVLQPQPLVVPQLVVPQLVVQPLVVPQQAALQGFRRLPW